LDFESVLNRLDLKKFVWAPHKLCDPVSPRH